MVVELSYWEDGLREWNYLEDAGEYVYPGDEQYMGVSEIYKNTYELNRTIIDFNNIPEELVQEFMSSKF